MEQYHDQQQHLVLMDGFVLNLAIMLFDKFSMTRSGHREIEALEGRESKEKGRDNQRERPIDYTNSGK